MKVKTKSLNDLLTRAIRVTGKPDNININGTKEELLCQYSSNGYKAMITVPIESQNKFKFSIEADLFLSIIKKAKDEIDISIDGNSLSFKSGNMHGKNIAIMDTEANFKFNQGELLNQKVSDRLIHLLDFANLDNPDISTKDSLTLSLHDDGKKQYAFCATNYYASLVTTKSLGITAQFSATHARQIASAFKNSQLFFNEVENSLKVGNENIIFFMPLMQISAEQIKYKDVLALKETKAVYEITYAPSDILNNIEVSRFVSEENQPYIFELTEDKIVCGFESNKGSVQTAINIKKGPSKKTRIAVNAKHFVHILNKVKSNKDVILKFTSSHLAVMAEDSSICYFLMLLEERG